MFIFTICSNNYLAQAIVLGNSVKSNIANVEFAIFLVDEKNNEINYDNIPHEIVPLGMIEPDLNDLVIKYDIIELNTAVKPRVIEYLFLERNAQKVIYLDPDIRVFSPFNSLEAELDNYSIVLTPHIYSPIPKDGYSPQEDLFLNYGIYNLGFIGLSRSEETFKLLTWWKEWTYTNGYDRVSKGIFVDQLPINLVPIFFKSVLILNHIGYNMAPWNLHERYLSEHNQSYFVNGEIPLVFYHFSSFRINTGELPVFNYNRFYMKDRGDLLRIHKIYNDELKNAGFNFYQRIRCKYVLDREKFIEKEKLEKWKIIPLHKKMALLFLRSHLLKKIGGIISFHNSHY